MKVLQGKRIFIVEDNPLNRLVFRLSLTKAGAYVEFDAGGSETVTGLEKFAPVDMILLDLMLARGQNGFDLFQIIRNVPEFAKTPIVAVSATDPNIAIARAQTEGFHGFIAKPIDSDLFPEQLIAILQGNRLWKEQGSGPSTLTQFPAPSIIK